MKGLLRRWPLRVKLILIAWLAVILTLGISGPLIVVLVRSSLIEQVDVQLQQAASDVAQTAASEISTRREVADERLPSDYFVQFQINESRTSLQAGSAPSALGAVPNIPDLSPRQVGQRLGPETVNSSSGSTKWRFVALPVAVHSQAGTTPGTVAVALPLTAVEATIGQITGVIFGVGIAVLLLASGVSWFAVDRALRPLRKVEATAGAIADGDLSQRVEVTPLSTEVGRLSHALNTMLAQIEEAFAQRDVSEARLRQFVADASHELRTPLAVLRGYAELYRQGGIPEDELSATMERIESESQRLGDLVAGLLTLTRIDDAAAETQFLESDATSVDSVKSFAEESAGENADAPGQQADLMAVVGEAARDLRALDPTRSVTVTAPEGAGEDEGLWVRGDSDSLRQVLSNLVGNIVQHTPKESAVEFELAKGADETAILRVRDFGPGVPGAERGAIFDRFRRVDSSRTRAGGGAGLGLAIVAAIVAARGGKVRALPTAPRGLTIEIRLPLAR